MREFHIKAFEIVENDIKTLTPENLTQLMKHLLRIELSKLKLSASQLTVSLDINDPDGGLDGFINCDIPAGHDWLPEGKSGWQFKTNDNFSASNARQEVAPNDQLKPRIRKLLENNHSYVLVVSGKDFNQTKAEEISQVINQVFIDNDFPDSNITVYSRGKIANWINENPSVMSHFNPTRLNFKNMDQMETSVSDITDPKSFIIDEDRKKIIDEIRGVIRGNVTSTKSIIVRLVGLSGVGKTRLIYEALNADELRNLVLYAETPDKLPPSKFNEIANNHNWKLILVIDECSHEKYLELAKEAEGIGGRFILITLDYDKDNRRNHRDMHIILNPLSIDAMGKLCDSLLPELPPEIRERLIRFADGFPRILTLLAEKIHEDPDFITPAKILSLPMDDIFDQLVKGRMTDVGQIRNVKRLLQYFSLFQRVGVEDDVESQGQFLSTCVGISWEETKDIIQRQDERRILRKRGKYYYLSPFPLALYLFQEKMKTMDTKTMVDFIGRFPDDDIKKSFYKRMSETGLVDNLPADVRRLFDEFNFDTIKEETGSGFFLSLVDTNPNYAVKTLERIFSSKTREELLEFKNGRRNILFSLEKILLYPENFDTSVNILLQLANAENETWSNNSTEIFNQCFRIALSGTPIPAWERIPFLAKYVNSVDTSIKLLVLGALNSSFYLGPSSRNSGYENDSLRTPPSEWNPKSLNDIDRSIKEAFKIYDLFLNDENESSLYQTGKILINNSRFLVPNYSHEVIDHYTSLKVKTNLFDNEILESIETILYYDKNRLSKDVLLFIEEYKDKNTKNDYSGRMDRYVKNVFSIDYNDESVINEKIIKLAQESLKKPELLVGEFGWLLTNNAKNGYLFGYNLGKVDEKISLLDVILEKIKYIEEPSIFFISGYLNVVKEKNYGAWKNVINQFESNERLKNKIIELIWRSGVNNNDVSIILRLMESGKLESNFVNTFIYGAWWSKIEASFFIKFLNEYKLQYSKYSPSLLGIIYQFSEKKSDFIKSNEDLLLYFIENFLSMDIHDSMFFYYLRNLLLPLIENGKNDAKYFSVIQSLIEKNYHENNELIYSSVNILLNKNFDYTWNTIKNMLSVDNMNYYLVDLLKGGTFNKKNTPLIDKIPIDKIDNWVKEKPNIAPYILAKLIPFGTDNSKIHPLLKYLLLTQENNVKIYSALSANWHTEMWTGSRSSHIENKIAIAKKWSESSEDYVKKWLNIEINSMTEELTALKKRDGEETDFFI